MENKQTFFIKNIEKGIYVKPFNEIAVMVVGFNLQNLFVLID